MGYFIALTSTRQNNIYIYGANIMKDTDYVTLIFCAAADG